MTQFTASEVRTESCKQWQLHRQPASDMLNAFADLLEAREKAVPVAYAAGLEANMRGFLDVMAWSEGEFTIPLYTHPAPSDAEKRETMTPRELAKRIERGEKWKLADEPAPCQSQNADRLAEALRRTCRKMKTFSRTGALDGAVAVWVDEIESVLAAHSTQAQPPANTERLAELLRGLEIGPMAATLSPKKLFAIGAAIAAQAKEAQAAAASVPDAETLRLHLGELTPDEVCVAKAAYRLALAAQENPNG